MFITIHFLFLLLTGHLRMVVEFEKGSKPVFGVGSDLQGDGDAAGIDKLAGLIGVVFDEEIENLMGNDGRVIEIVGSVEDIGNIVPVVSDRNRLAVVDIKHIGDF